MTMAPPSWGHICADTMALLWCPRRCCCCRGLSTMWQCSGSRLGSLRHLSVALGEHGEPWPLSTTLKPHRITKRSIQMCVSHVSLPSISACFSVCVWMLELDDGPRARYHMLSSVGTWSPLDNVILQWPTPLQGCGNQRRMCGHSYLFIYSFSFFLIFLFSTFWYKYHHHYRCCFPPSCRQSEVWYVATTGEKHVAGSWPTSLTYIPSQTNHKFSAEALSNRRWWVWAWWHNLPILRQDHGKRMFIALCFFMWLVSNVLGEFAFCLFVEMTGQETWSLLKVYILIDQNTVQWFLDYWCGEWEVKGPMFY